MATARWTAFDLSASTHFFQTRLQLCFDQVLARRRRAFRRQLSRRKRCSRLARAARLQHGRHRQDGPGRDSGRGGDRRRRAPARFRRRPGTIVVDDSTGSASGLSLAAAAARPRGPGACPLEPPTAHATATAPPRRTTTATAATVTHPARRMAEHRPAAVVRRRRDHACILPLVRATTGKPFALACTGRAIPTARSTIRATASTRSQPGINGATSQLRPCANADRTLGQLIAWLDAHPGVKAQHRPLRDLRPRVRHRSAVARSIAAADDDARPSRRRHDYLDAQRSRSKPRPGHAARSGFWRSISRCDLQPDAVRSRPARRPAARAFHAAPHAGPRPWEHPADGNGLIGTERS